MGNNHSYFDQKLKEQWEAFENLRKSFEDSQKQRQEDEQKRQQEINRLQLLYEQELLTRKNQEKSLQHEFDKKFDELQKKVQQDLEVKIKNIYEEIRRKEQKEAEERRKFKEEYPIPKFLDPNVINVAITGPSGAGKSTLVNLLRGIKYGEEGEAKTDINECTFEPISYTFAKTHPLHNVVHLWDLPGAGTAAFPQETYIQNMGIRWYDAVVVVGDTRVRDVDVSLMKELKRTLVRFVYVRTKMDNQVEANELKNIDPKQTFKEVRGNLQVKSNIQKPYLIGLKYVLKKGLDQWQNEDFVELKKVLEMMCVESAEENQKEELSESVKNSYLKFDTLII